MDFLDRNGLQTLWSKIKNNFVRTVNETSIDNTGNINITHVHSADYAKNLEGTSSKILIESFISKISQYGGQGSLLRLQGNSIFNGRQINKGTATININNTGENSFSNYTFNERIWYEKKGTSDNQTFTYNGSQWEDDINPLDYGIILNGISLSGSFWVETAATTSVEPDLDSNWFAQQNPGINEVILYYKTINNVTGWATKDDNDTYTLIGDGISDFPYDIGSNAALNFLYGVDYKDQTFTVDDELSIYYFAGIESLILEISNVSIDFGNYVSTKPLSFDSIDTNDVTLSRIIMWGDTPLDGGGEVKLQLKAITNTVIPENLIDFTTIKNGKIEDVGNGEYIYNADVNSRSVLIPCEAETTYLIDTDLNNFFIGSVDDTFDGINNTDLQNATQITNSSGSFITASEGTRLLITYATSTSIDTNAILHRIKVYKQIVANAVIDLPGWGLASISSIKDEVNFDTMKYIQKIGRENVNCTNTFSTDIIEDEDYRYYKLETPIEYTLVPYTDFTNEFNLVINGTEIFNIDSSSLNVPIVCEALYGENLVQKLESLTASDPYPVGSIYLTLANINPAELFGGSWTKLGGRFLLGANSTYPVSELTYNEVWQTWTATNAGGEATHTLTLEEIPPHTHPVGGTGRNTNTTTGSGSNKDAFRIETYTGHNDWRTSTGSTGGSQNTTIPHNNMPPYLTVYMWYRYA